MIHIIARALEDLNVAELLAKDHELIVLALRTETSGVLRVHLDEGLSTGLALRREEGKVRRGVNKVRTMLEAKLFSFLGLQGASILRITLEKVLSFLCLQEGAPFLGTSKKGFPS